MIYNLRFQIRSSKFKSFSRRIRLLNVIFWLFENWSLKIGQFSRRANRGSALLLSILVLATIGSSMYVLSSVAIRTMRQVHSTISGENVILGADGAAEQGLWKHVRQGLLTECPDFLTGTTLPNQISDVSTRFCQMNYRSNPAMVEIGPNLTRVIILDSNNMSEPSNYSELNFTLSGNSGTVTVCEWVAPDCETDYIMRFSMPPQTNQTVGPLNYYGEPNNDRYMILLQAGSNGFAVSISGKDEDGNDKGMPSDWTTVRGRADDDISTRLYEVENVVR